MSFPSSPSFAGKTLVIPAVSYGNVGQLAVDILLCTALSTSDATHVGHLQSRHLLPVAGTDPFGISSSPQAVATPCEIYECTRANVVLMQRRSMCVKGRANDFALELAAWCKEQQFGQIVVLAGADSGSLRDRAIHDSLQQGMCHFVTSSSSSMKEFSAFNSWQPFTQLERDPDGDLVPPSTDSSSRVKFPSNVHMAGLSKRLFVACTEMEVPVTTLMCFVAEGYNVPDGIRMATSLCEYLPGLAPRSVKQNESKNWTIPTSWNTLAPNQPCEPNLFY